MQQLTDEGRRIVDGVAQRHGFSSDAVLTMLLAVSAGYGNQAQFNHNEFGGMGQWSSGGMTMIGDMFNNYLKGRVASLCQELSTLIQGQPLFAVPAQSQSQSQGGGWQGQSGGNSQQQSSGGGMGSGMNSGAGTSLFVPNRSNNWWPSDLGMAGSTGSQNNLRYAYFPNAHRLAIDQGGQVTVYNTLDHQIGGFGQQQSGDQSITFTSQYGLVRVADLPQIMDNNYSQNTSNTSFSTSNSNAPAFQTNPAPAPKPANTWAPAPVILDPLPPATPNPNPSHNAQPHVSSNEIFGLLEKLADLHGKGILTDTEYETKKAEMLKRL
ncbi:MAG: SHOCT domain-containing protein [Hyphomicrobiaceae bacterium]